jgi:rhamnogalacturonyl hydrolase YesR
MLPDFIFPYKHYRADIIEAVIDGTEIFFAIEESTIYRWKRWYRSIREQLNSNLRAVWQAEEGLFYSLLDNTYSLLEKLRQSGGKWLAKAIGITINAGYPAYTQFAYSPLLICGRLDTS